MGKFNLKTYSDSIVSFLAGNMQNKSAVKNKTYTNYLQNKTIYFNIFNCFIPDPSPEKRDQECSADQESKIWGNYYREDKYGKNSSNFFKRPFTFYSQIQG